MRSEIAERDGMPERTMAYRYGCPSWAELDTAAMAQLRLANDLWNALVAAERAHREEVAEIWSRHPGVAAAQEALAETAAAVEAIEAEMRAARQQDETTLPRKSDAARLKAAKAARTVARGAVKSAKGAVIEAGLEPGFAEIKAACRACQSGRSKPPDSFYKEFTAAGLGWGTINDITARFRTAAARVTADHMSGKAAELRFRRFDGSGTLTVQVQREAGGPVPSPALLASGEGKWRNQVQFGPWEDPAEAGAPKGAARYGTLRLRVAADLHVTLPVVVHRWLPAGAEVKLVRISRLRVAGQHRLSASVTFRVPAPEPAQGIGAVSVRLSWKSAGEGSLHAAHIGSSEPLAALPADLAEIMRVSPGRLSADLYFPPEWRAPLERGRRIDGYRDLLLEYVREAATVALKADVSLGELLGTTAAEVSRWRAQRKFVLLVRDWQGLLADGQTRVPLPPVPVALLADPEHPETVLACQPPPGRRGLHAGRGAHEHDLECWRLRDAHLWEFRAHEIAQVLARRRDAYRKVAAWLCEGAARVVLHDLDLAELRRVPGVAQEDPERDRHGRSHAQEVAPGELAEAVRQAAMARGISVRSSREMEG